MTVQVLDDGRTDGSNMGGGVTNAKLSFFSGGYYLKAKSQ